MTKLLSKIAVIKKLNFNEIWFMLITSLWHKGRKFKVSLIIWIFKEIFLFNFHKKVIMEDPSIASYALKNYPYKNSIMKKENIFFHKQVR